MVPHSQSLAVINTRLIHPEAPEVTVIVEDGKIAGTGENLSLHPKTRIIDARGSVMLPGLVDVHVHLREPGYEYKETIASGTRAAAAGGFTTICSMPNLNPCPDSVENIEKILNPIRHDALIETVPYAAITKGRMGRKLLDDYAALAPFVAGFSDDGSGVVDYEVMEQAMTLIAATGKILAAHCEVISLVNRGYIHDGKYARAHSHRGICSESEYAEVERNIQLAARTGCHLHICHVSTKESVELVRRAKREGLPVTCETAAHYLAFSDADLQEDGRFKMNPPLRDISDREALLRGCADGTIDVIASDHAPHSADEKNRGLEKSAMGVTGIELSLPAVYTYAVKPGHISFDRMVEMMALAPRKIFGFAGGISAGDRADFTLVDFNRCFDVDPDKLLSMGKATPFAGLKLWGEVLCTVSAGEQLFSRL